jgi:CRISPR-associated protein Cas2
MADERAFYLAAYDIVEDRRRNKVARAMAASGERVQRSVFELYLTDKELEKLKRRLGKLIDPHEDSVRIYQLCAACRGKVATLGQGKVSDPPGLMIV